MHNVPTYLHRSLTPLEAAESDDVGGVGAAPLHADTNEEETDA